MLTKISIKNYRCFENSTITLQPTSVLVGRNNAGKSTLIETLKILSVVTRKYKNAHFVTPPSWVKGETDNGIMPSAGNLNLSDKGLFYMYGEPPAVIEAHFANSSRVKVYVGESMSLFAIIIGPDGNPARNNKAVRSIEIPVIEVLPQISAVLDIEPLVRKETVDYNMPTRLTSRNFRNQIYYYNQYYTRFKQLAEATWEQLLVQSVNREVGDNGPELKFYVRDNSFTAEIAWMGHGLQMWLQTMWFLARCDEKSIVVLDEPDVYMHADLQRRLIRLVAPMFSQLIVATHSVEIMEEVSLKSIIPINSRRRQIKPIGNHSLLVKLTEELGSAFNLDLSRLFLSKRFMIWEGEDTDRQILSLFQAILYPRDLHPISSFPKVYVEGWGGWQRALAVAEVFNQNSVDVKCYCLFDSDYHTQEDIEQRNQDAYNHHINLHIWSRKEIENYVIHPSVILRYIKQNKRKGQINEVVLREKMQELAETMKDEFISDVAEEYRMKDMKISVKTARQMARERIKHIWKENPFYVLPGKTVISHLSQWSKANYGVSFNALNLVRIFYPDEVPEEVRELIAAIMDGRPI